MTHTRRTSVRHHRFHIDNEPAMVAEAARISTLLIGTGYGINATVRLTNANLQFPYVSAQLASHLPLPFYQSVVVPFFVGGTFANYYIHLGTVIDIAIARLKTFPWKGTPAEIKDWLAKTDITNISDIVGALFGVALSGAFIYYNATSGDPFALPYEANQGVSDWLLQAGATLYLSGACSNTITYGVEGIRQVFYGTGYLFNGLAHKVEDIITLPQIKLDNPATKMNLWANLLIVPGALLGIGYGIYASVELQTDDLKSFPYISNELGAHLPLSFYQAIVPIFVGGTFANYYSHLGAAGDIVINSAKTFPWKGTKTEIKTWLQKSDPIKASLVFGALFGVSLSAAFIYYNATSGDPFSLPYGANKGVPDWLLCAGAPLGIGGACPNLFSYYVEAAVTTARFTYKICTQSVSSASSKVKALLPFSIFKKPVNPLSASLPPPPAQPSSPTLSRHSPV